MGRGPNSEWTLYVDESGDFDASESVGRVVGGLLLRDAETGKTNRALRAAIEDIYPLSPWPPHGAILRKPLSRLAFALRPSLPRTAREEKARARVLELLPHVEATELGRRLVAAARSGAALSYAELESAQTGVSSDALRTLRQIGNEEDSKLVSLLRDVAHTTTAFVVCAADYGDAVAAAAPLRTAVADVYLGALEAVLGRVAQLTAERGAAAVVRYRVAKRDVREPLSGRFFPLSALHVNEVAARALADAPASPAARFVALSVVEDGNGPGAHPGVVLADFLCSRLRWELARRQTLAMAAARVLATTGLPARATPRRAPSAELPSLAATGPMRTVVARALSGVAASAAPLEPSWVGEQAAEWLAAAEEWRA